MNIPNFFKSKVTVTFFMKSGNKIVADNVIKENFVVTTKGDAIYKIEGFHQHKPYNKLFLNTLNFNQIEAITIS